MEILCNGVSCGVRYEIASGEFQDFLNTIEKVPRLLEYIDK